MKTLSLARPRILMLAGIPGAGKSTFASAFADMFGVSYISSDLLRAELFADPQFSKDEEAIIGRLQTYMVQEVIKNKRSFLLDGGCNTKTDRLKVEQCAKKNGYDTLVIWVQTNPDTAKSRATGRARTSDSHKPLPEAVFTRLAKQFSPPTTEDYIVISGMHTFTTQVRTVLRKLTANSRPKEPHPQKPRTAPAPARGIVIR
ncbi:MAG TPA: ATP-binding protein [Candidatus Saccharimonadales bacterium]|nr:ATP-binding protein [Candidatus Saccharimonadales bacterium]